MIETQQTIAVKKLPKTYAELAALHLPRPIRDEATYRQTVEMVDQLAGRSLNRDQSDYLDILSQQIETYEAATTKQPKSISGISLLKLLLKEHEMSGDDLAGLLGVDRSVAYKILKGARNLTAEHIRKLADRFALSADAFLETGR
jgi:HTH-type transcriptional regulator/antitoxin HigA